MGMLLAYHREQPEPVEEVKPAPKFQAPVQVSIEPAVVEPELVVEEVVEKKKPGRPPKEH